MHIFETAKQYSDIERKRRVDQCEALCVTWWHTDVEEKLHRMRKVHEPLNTQREKNPSCVLLFESNTTTYTVKKQRILFLEIEAPPYIY